MVALSTIETEYMAMAKVVKESMWLKGLVGDFGVELEMIVVYSNNQSAICLIKNQVYHERTKHIDIWYHFIRDVANRGMGKYDDKAHDYEQVQTLPGLGGHLQQVR